MLAVSVLALATLGAARGAFAQAEPAAPPSRVRVVLDVGHPVGEFLRHGFDVTQVSGDSVEILAWGGDERRLAALGFVVEVLDPDPGASAARIADEELSRRPAIARSATGPPPIGSGSMGGYWTLEEVKQKLDELVATDAFGVVSDRIDTLGWSWQGRPIWALRIGLHADTPGADPAVVYTSLTHAREPGGMQTLFYFVDDLLAGYPGEPWKRFLLEHRALVIVPVLNPDGYAYNRAHQPNGGGMWRKNLSPSGAVDINRNYGYKWGYDNTGSSGAVNDEDYRGPAPFSEPETVAHRALIDSLRPRVSVSVHSNGGYALYPWGYAAPADPHQSDFREMSDELTCTNGYRAGPTWKTLYRVNGGLDDWCYGDTLSKPRAFTWTIEVGTPSEYFWPAPSRIEPIARENLGACYAAAAIAGSWVRVDRFLIDGDHLDAGRATTLRVRARNLGLDPSPATLAATLTPLDAGIQVASGPLDYPALSTRQTAWATSGAGFVVAAADTVTPGRLVRFLIEFSEPDGSYARDTLETIVGTPTVLVFDPIGYSYTGWTSHGWLAYGSEADHPGRYYYSSGGGSTLTRALPVRLDAGVHAWLTFGAHWSTSIDRTYASVQASTDSVTWTTLQGSSTLPERRSPNPPGYIGTQALWRPQRVDLSAFAGAGAAPVWLRFLLGGDAPGGGMFLDSLRILVYDATVQPPPLAAPGVDVASVLALDLPFPSPARDLTQIAFTLPVASTARLEVLDISGRRVRLLAHRDFASGRHSIGWDLRDDGERRVPAGLYFVRLVTPGRRATRRVLVLP